MSESKEEELAVLRAKVESQNKKLAMMRGKVAGFEATLKTVEGIIQATTPYYKKRVVHSHSRKFSLLLVSTSNYY